jgi:hypothetical protein
MVLTNAQQAAALSAVVRPKCGQPGRVSKLDHRFGVKAALTSTLPMTRCSEGRFTQRVNLLRS